MDNEEEEEYLAEERRHLRELEQFLKPFESDKTTQTPGLSYWVDVPDISQMSLDSLVALREQHQTYHAAHSVRVQRDASGIDDVTDASNSTKTTESLVRKEILATYHKTLREGQSHGITTGTGRKTRWTMSDGASQQDSTGNSLNAKKVAATTATKVRDLYLAHVTSRSSAYSHYVRQQHSDVTHFSRQNFWWLIITLFRWHE